jgi:hypothetical protein
VQEREYPEQTQMGWLSSKMDFCRRLTREGEREGVEIEGMTGQGQMERMERYNRTVEGSKEYNRQ